MARAIEEAALHQLDGVRLWLEGSDRSVIPSHKNAFANFARDRNSKFISRPIQATSGDEVKINLDFENDFDLLGASGVRVTIALGHTHRCTSSLKNSQSWWSDAANLKKTHTFFSFSTWKTKDGEPEAIKFTFPVPYANPVERSKNVMWNFINLAKKGCIAVSVARGELTNHVECHPLHRTDPPSTHRRETTGIPRVISWHWFSPSFPYFSEVLVFELRNTVGGNANSRAAIQADPQRDRAISPVFPDFASMSEDGMTAKLLENSLGDLRTAARAGTGANGAVSNSSEGMRRGEAAREVIVTPPPPVTSRTQGLKRKTPPHNTASELEGPVRQPRSGKSSKSIDPARHIENCDVADSDNSEGPKSRPVEPDAIRITQGPIDLIELTQDDRQESPDVTRKAVEGTASGQDKQESLEELQLQLLESEEQERIHQERLKQVQIRQKIRSLRAGADVTKRQ